MWAIRSAIRSTLLRTRILAAVEASRTQNLAVCSRRAISLGLVNDRHGSRLVRCDANEFERCALGEERLAGTERDRTNIQAILVDQLVLDEALRGLDATVEQQIRARHCLELLQFGSQVPVICHQELLTVFPHKLFRRGGDDDF